MPCGKCPGSIKSTSSISQSNNGLALINQILGSSSQSNDGLTLINQILGLSS